MAAKLLNIEIGDRLSKVCRSVRRGKTCQIESSFLFATPAGTVSDGVIGDPAALAEELAAQLKSHNLQGTADVAFTVVSSRVATREVTLPPVKDNRIQSLVETNAAEYFPVDMSNYQIGYTLLERAGGSEPGLRVLVMAAPTALLDGYIAVADACALRVQSIDYSGNSQYQALRALHQDGVVMYVNVGCSSTYCSFLKGGVLLLQRTFSFGGGDLIAGYLSAAGRPETDLLSALTELNGDASLVSEEDVSDTLERLVGSVIRSGDYFSSTQGQAVDQIALMGPCAHLPHLCQLVAAGSGVETIYLEEIPGVDHLADAAESAACYLSCVGGAIAPADLLPLSYKNRKKRASSREKAKTGDSLSGGILICGVCVAASLVLCAISVLGYLGEQKQLQTMQDRIAELSYVEQVHDQYVAYTQTQDGLRQVETTARGNNAQLEPFFTELERKMPASILLLTASCTEEGITLDVTVPGLAESAVVINQLRTFESIDVVQVSEVTEEVTEAGVQRATFSVSCLYPVPVVAENAETGDTAAADAAQTETDRSEKTISKRDAKLLLILLGLVVFLLSYLLVYNRYIEKQDAVAAQIAELQPTLDTLEEYYVNLSTYETATAAAQKDIAEQLTHYPSEVLAEDLLLYAIDLEDRVGLNATALSFTDPVLISEFGGMVNQDGEETPVVMDAYETSADIACSLSYDQLKAALRYIYDSNLCTAVNSVSVSYNAETGALLGNLNVAKYSVTWEGAPETAHAMPYVQKSQTQLFG